jgi:hypothetical protein
MSALADVYGDLLIVRPPVPATCNKAGANYKSEVTHLDYSPRRAYDEWLSICDAIVACGGDALYQFEAADEPFLGHAALEVDADGAIRPAGAREVLGDLAEVATGRVFTANGPWVTVRDRQLRAVMQHMLAHRRGEASYYEGLLAQIADAGGYELELTPNPHRWEGMADVAAVGDKVVLTYAVPGHYDQGIGPKSPRSSREGVAFAADHAGVPASARVYVELVYPHFHGDTVHFGARPVGAPPVLVHYAGGLWGDGHDVVLQALGGPCRSAWTTRSGPTPATRARSATACWCPTASARASSSRCAGSGCARTRCRCSSCSARRAVARPARRCTCRSRCASHPTRPSGTACRATPHGLAATRSLSGLRSRRTTSAARPAADPFL